MTHDDLIEKLTKKLVGEDHRVFSQALRDLARLAVDCIIANDPQLLHRVEMALAEAAMDIMVGRYTGQDADTRAMGIDSLRNVTQLALHRRPPRDYNQQRAHEEHLWRQVVHLHPATHDIGFSATQLIEAAGCTGAEARAFLSGNQGQFSVAVDEENGKIARFRLKNPEPFLQAYKKDAA